MKKLSKKILIPIIICIYALIAFAFTYAIYKGGDYPTGANTMGFLYRARVLLDGIGQGDLFPSYDPYWFNGQQLLRYVEPLPLYVLAACIGSAGKIIPGYLIFVMALAIATSVPWLWIGCKMDRLALAACMGPIWFFLPANMYNLFVRGSLNEAMAYVAIPILIMLTYLWLHEENNKTSYLLGLILTECYIANCSVTVSIEMFITMAVYALFTLVRHKKLKKFVMLLMSLILGIGIFAIWIYPSTRGDFYEIRNVELMARYFQDAIVSLNPMYRVAGDDSRYYFGLSIFAVGIFGIVAGRDNDKKSLALGILLFMASTPSAYGMFSKIPGNNYLWMARYMTIAAALILISFISWKKLRKGFLVLCMGLLVLDIIPSIMVHIGDGRYTAKAKADTFTSANMIDEARAITNQRMIFIDGDRYESDGDYYAAAAEDGNGMVPQSGGDNIGFAATHENLLDLNDAISARHYTYLFDRLLTLGDDTVLLSTYTSEYLTADIDEVIAAAAMSGYKLVDNDRFTYLFHRETPQTYGVTTVFDAISIGDTGKLLSYSYVDMEQGKSNNLNDYTYDELKGYKLIYLSGFTFDDQAKAEELILKLAQSDVKIVIDGSGIPVDKHTGIQNFLGVTCQPIKFENGYPILYFNHEEVVCKLFPVNDRKWSTVYLNGLDHVKGYLYENGVQLAYAGTAENENINFVGISLAYHYYATLDDKGSKKILDNMMWQYMDEVPQRTLVPLDITYGKDEITIKSDYDDVNTTLAAVDTMTGDFDSIINLVFVDKGTTTIKMRNPYIVKGACISILALVGTVLMLVLNQKRESANAQNENQ